MHMLLMQVVWSAWLSTLGHAPSVMDLADSQNMHNFTDSASSLVDQFVPVSLQVCLLPLSVVTAHSMYDDCWQSLSAISAAATVCCCCYCLLLLSAAAAATVAAVTSCCCCCCCLLLLNIPHTVTVCYHSLPLSKGFRVLQMLWVASV